MCFGDMSLINNEIAISSQLSQLAATCRSTITSLIKTMSFEYDLADGGTPSMVSSDCPAELVPPRTFHEDFQ